MRRRTVERIKDVVMWLMALAFVGIAVWVVIEALRGILF